MINSKTYLNVPYAEKDAAKALGGKWDPAKKKWYVPANIDIKPFVKWQPVLDALEAAPTTSKAGTSATTRPNVKKSLSGIVTHAKDKNFVAYSGDKPPWD